MSAIPWRMATRLAAMLSAAAALMMLASCGSSSEPEHETNAASAATVDVRTAMASSSTIGFLTIPGNVEATRSVSIAARIPGVIDHLAIEEGTRVRKGDLLVRLDGHELKTQVEAASAVVVVARSHFERIRALYEKEAATRQEMEEARARQLSAEAALAGAKARLGYIELKAPFDGVIVEKMAAAGELAAPGVAILTLQDVDRMRVAATITGSQMQRLAIGLSLDASIEGGPSEPCAVSILSPGGEVGSGRFLLKCDLPGETTARSGSFARVRVPGEATELSVLAHRAALIERGGLAALFVVKDGKAWLRYIRLGAIEGDLMVVRAGLAADDEVVLNPGALGDGATVRTTPVEQPR